MLTPTSHHIWGPWLWGCELGQRGQAMPGGRPPPHSKHPLAPTSKYSIFSATSTEPHASFCFKLLA